MPRNDNRRLWICIGASLVLHVLLLALWLLGAANWFAKISQKELPASSIKLTLIAPPMPVPTVKAPRTAPFIPTVESQQVKEASERAPFESERNTQQRTTAPRPRDAASGLPEMAGRRESASYLDHDNPSRQTPGKPVPSAAAPPAPLSNPQPPAPQTPLPEAPKPSPEPPTPKPAAPASENALAVLPRASEQAAPAAHPPAPRAQPAAASPVEAARPPPSFSADVHGGGAAGAPSPESRETELGRYKAKIYRAVGYRWHLKVNAALSTLSIGGVRIKFFIRANGVIENLQIIEDTGAADGRTATLKTISKESILEAGPFEPFSESLKQQLGEGYEEEFGFTIY